MTHEHLFAYLFILILTYYILVKEYFSYDFNSLEFSTGSFDSAYCKHLEMFRMDLKIIHILKLCAYN